MQLHRRLSRKASSAHHPRHPLRNYTQEQLRSSMALLGPEWPTVTRTYPRRSSTRQTSFLEPESDGNNLFHCHGLSYPLRQTDDGYSIATIAFSAPFFTQGHSPLTRRYRPISHRLTSLNIQNSSTMYLRSGNRQANQPTYPPESNSRQLMPKAKATLRRLRQP